MKLDEITTFSYGGKYQELCDLTGHERQAVIRLAKDYAKQFIDKAEEIITPALDILPSTYQKEIDAWYELTPKNEQ